MRGPTTLIGIVLTTIVLVSTTASAGEEHHELLYATAGGMAVSSEDGYTVGLIIGMLDPIPLSGQEQAHILASDIVNPNMVVAYEATRSVLIGCEIFCTFDIEVLSSGTICREATITLPPEADQLRLYVPGTFNIAHSLVTAPTCGGQADFATSGIIDVWLA